MAGILHLTEILKHNRSAKDAGQFTATMIISTHLGWIICPNWAKFKSPAWCRNQNSEFRFLEICSQTDIQQFFRLCKYSLVVYLQPKHTTGLRSTQGPKFKILLPRSSVPRPTDYTCQVASTSAQRSREP